MSVSSSARFPTTSPDASSKVMKKAALLLTIGIAIGVQAAFFVPVASAATLYSQPNNSVSSVYWTNGAGYTFLDDNGSSTQAFNLGNIFPAGITIPIGAHLRYWVYLADDGTNYGDTAVFVYSDIIGGTALCGGTSGQQFTVHNQWALIDYACNSGPITIGPGHNILLVFSSGSFPTHVTYSALQGQGGGNSWRGFQPYWEISDATGLFDGPAPAATSSSQVNIGISPTVQAIGVATTTAAALCTSQNATSTGILDTITNGFGVAMCYAGTLLFVPSQNSVQQFSTLSSSTQSKIPFSYYYDFANILGGSSASSTGNFSVLSVDLRSTGVGSTSPWATVLPTSFTYLASSTIGTYIPKGLYDVLFLLMRSAIWIVVLFHIYHRLRPKHATHV